MEGTKIDINVLIRLYNQRILELESKNILLQAQVLQVEKEENNKKIEKESVK